MSKKLFQAFEPTTKPAWLEKLTKDLKGRSMDDLNWRVDEAISLAPFYHPNDKIKTNTLAAKKADNTWEISEDIVLDAEDYKQGNQFLLAALNCGINAPRLMFEKAPSQEDWGTIFKAVNLDWISTHLFCVRETEGINGAKSFAAFCKATYGRKKLKGSINISEDAYQKKEYTDLLDKDLKHFKLFTIDVAEECTTVENTVEELLAIIMKGKDLLASFESTNFEKKAASFQFSIGIGTSYFVQIAKIRALKILWGTILDAYGLKNQDCCIEAHLPWNTQTENENMNMIRSTTQAMAAVIGGVQRLNILPANSKTEGPSNFTRRIARNVQHILQLESYLNEVQDPASGSYYIEQLTNELAEQTWKEFQAKHTFPLGDLSMLLMS